MNLFYLVNLKQTHMKNLIVFGVFIILLILVQFAQAQTVDEVIEKHITAMGGKEKLATLNNFRMEGNLNYQGTDVSITITKLHSVGARTDIAVMGSQNYRLVTPAAGVVFMPVMGQAAPADMPAEELKFDQVFLDLHGIFVDYKEKGIQVTLAGKETVDGIECYKLKASFKNGNTTIFYIDAKTYRLYKAAESGEESEIFTIYTNYKQTADGYWFAYSTTNARGQTDFDKIETNIKVDEAIFKTN
jgi:predicted RNA-binding protein with PIN domain